MSKRVRRGFNVERPLLWLLKGEEELTRPRREKYQTQREKPNVQTHRGVVGSAILGDGCVAGA